MSAPLIGWVWRRKPETLPGWYLRLTGPRRWVFREGSRRPEYIDERFECVPVYGPVEP